MAKPRGRPFPKGVSANPSGRPKVPEELKAVKRLSGDQFIELVTLILSKTREELEQIIAGPNVPYFQEMLIATFLKMPEVGDYRVIDKLLDRLIGPVPRDVKLLDDRDQAILDRVKLLDRIPEQERIMMLKKAIEQGKTEIEINPEDYDGRNSDTEVAPE